MKFFSNALFVLFTIASTTFGSKEECRSVPVTGIINPQNNCINFSVGQGTGCSWMCMLLTSPIPHTPFKTSLIQDFIRFHQNRVHPFMCVCLNARLHVWVGMYLDVLTWLWYCVPCTQVSTPTQCVQATGRP